MNTLSRILVTVLLLCIVVPAWAKGTPKSEPGADVPVLAQGNSAFALDLYAKLREKKGNFFFSPFSISTALGMTYAGARGNTEAQMAKVLCVPTYARQPKGPDGEAMRRFVRVPWDQPRLHAAFKELIGDLNAQEKKGGYQLSVANALWGQKGYGFRKQFLKLTQDSYGAGLRELDFKKAAKGATATINKWVEKETRGKIKDLIPPGILNAMTRLVLTNAIYFKGDWTHAFDKKATRKGPFLTADKKTVEVPMMRQTERFGYMETPAFQALDMPYGKGDLSMTVLLPRKVDGFGEFEKSLTSDNLAKWLPKLRRQRVTVEIPRFKVTAKCRLDKYLKAMGMTDAFSARAADFSGMNGRKDLFIHAVLHKAYVDVNEKGTEAAAATGIVVGLTSVQARPIVFRADQPFVFMIRDNRTGSILFMGRVLNPKARSM